MDDQEKLENLLSRLENYNTQTYKKKEIDDKNKVLKSAIELFDARKYIIGFFEKGTFPYKGNGLKTKEKKSEEIKGETKERFINNVIAVIEKESKNTNNDLFQKYFNFSAPIWLKNYLKQKIKRKTVSL